MRTGRAARETSTRKGETMNAVQVWKDGGEWFELWEDRKMVDIVSTREEASACGATSFTLTEEPRFLVRDQSGRGWCAEREYTSFDHEEREYREEGYDTDYAGNEIEFQSLGEWLDSSDAGDEFDNSDQMLTITRIN
jgi:hypothetical protein